MASEFPTARVADVCSLVVDCVNKTAPTVPGPTQYRMIRTTNVRNGRIDLSGCRYVDEMTYRTWTRRADLRDGDVILTREAPIGEVGIVQGIGSAFLGQRIMQYRANPIFLDARFLLYTFLSPSVQHQFGMHEGSGSVVSHIRVGDCSEFRIPCPSLPLQREISGLLGALDDKITLLRESNATLEAIAQALFKSWFVDFDPVSAKVEGRDPAGMSADVADLFPCEFEESVLGMIPKGWTVSRFENHLDVVRGLSYKGSGLTNRDDPEGVPMHNLNSVLEGGGYKYAGIKFYNGERKPKHEIRAGDIIVANTEQGHMHLLIGYPAVIPGHVGKVGIFSHHLYRVRPRSESSLGRLFVYRLLMVPAVREQIIGCSNGTTVNMLKSDGLTIPRFACPPRSLVKAFEDIMAPFHANQEHGVSEAENLVALRDSLLPRLMAGKFQFHHVEDLPCCAP
jgi:type I restriction enzyme S subunit